MAVAWFLLFFSVTIRQPWLAVCAFAVFVITAYRVSKTLTPDFSVIVGQTEKH
jgi:hypothetical protein